MKGLKYSLRNAAKAGRLPDPAEGDTGGVTVITIPVRDLEVTVAAALTAVGFGTAVLSGLPQGNLLILSAVAYLSMETTDTDLIAAFAGDFAIGTVATADVDVSDAGEFNIVASTEILAADRVVPMTRGTTTLTSGVPTIQLLDNTAGDLELNLNVLVDAASITDDTSATLTVNGVVYLAVCAMGDD